MFLQCQKFVSECQELEVELLDIIIHLTLHFLFHEVCLKQNTKGNMLKMEYIKVLLLAELFLSIPEAEGVPRCLRFKASLEKCSAPLEAPEILDKEHAPAIHLQTAVALVARDDFL